MDLLPLMLVCLQLSAVVHGSSHCVSRAGSVNIDTQCQKYCARGQCPNFCICLASNASDTCTKPDFLSSNKLAINETVRPGTPIFTIQVTGQERWSYTLGRGGPVDGSVWRYLSKYLKLTRIGNQYEMIVEVTPDLEDIFQRYGIKLTSLNLILTCEGAGHPSQAKEIELTILPVNEYSPEFFITPLKAEVPENTEAGTEVYSLSDHTIDADVSTAASNVLAFGLWEYLTDVMRDGRKYFQLTDTLKGVIQVKVKPDFEALQLTNATQVFLNVSASDPGNATSYTTLIIDVTDTDDLPPAFNHPSCIPRVEMSTPCVALYEATLPFYFQGEISNMTPGLIQARDMDSLNDPVSFSLKSGPRERPDIANNFTINETTGAIFILFPFEARQEVQLEIVARESNKNGRSAQAFLLVRPEDAVPVGKLDSSGSQASDNPTSAQTTARIFIISTVVLSICVLLLVLTILVLWAKLEARRLARVHPAAAAPNVQPDLRRYQTEMPKIPSQLSSFQYSTGDNFGHKSQTILTPSIEDVKRRQLKTEPKMDDLYNDFNQVSTAQTAVPHAMSHLPYSNSVRRHRGRSRSTLSSFEVQRGLPLALPDHRNMRNDLFQRLAIPNTEGCHFYGQNILALSDHPHMRTDACFPSNVLYLAGLPPTCSSHSKKDVAGRNQNFPSSTPRQPDDRLSQRGETESMSSDATLIFSDHDSGREVSKADGREPSTKGNILKADGSDVNNKTFTKEHTPPCDQRKKHQRSSSDEYSNKESDDESRNDNSISGESTQSCSERRSMPGQNKVMTCVLPAGRPSAVRQDTNGQSKYSEPFNLNSSHKSPVITAKAPLATPDGEQPEDLEKNNHWFYGQDGAKSGGTTTKGHNDLSVHSQENIAQSKMSANSLKTQDSEERQVETHFRKHISTSSLLPHGNLATIEVKPKSASWQDTKASSLGVVRRPLVGSVSSPMTGKRPVEEVLSRELSWRFDVVPSSPFVHDPPTMVETRPHTSDDVMHTKPARSSSCVPSRPFTSAPSRLKRRVRRRKRLTDVNTRADDYVGDYVRKIPQIILQRQYMAFPDYVPLEGSPQQICSHLYPWSIRHLLVPEPDSLDRLDTRYQGHRPDTAQIQQPGYENVYIQTSRQQTYALRPNQIQSHNEHAIKQPQHNHVIQQQLQHNHVIQQPQHNHVIQQPQHNHVIQQPQHNHVIQQQQDLQLVQEVTTGHRGHPSREKRRTQRSQSVAIQGKKSSLEAEQELNKPQKENERTDM